MPNHADKVQWGHKRGMRTIFTTVTAYRISHGNQNTTESTTNPLTPSKNK